MRGYEGRDPADVTAMFRIAYDVAIRRCDLCERCGEAPVSKVLRVKDPVWDAFDTPSKSAGGVRGVLRRRSAAGD